MPGVQGHGPLVPAALLPSIAAGAIALSLFLASVFALNLNQARLRENFGWVQHTDDVLLDIAAIEASLIDAQAGARGYLLTGDTDYLLPFDRAEAGLARQLDALAELVTDNPQQAERLEELRPIVGARMAEFKREIEYGPARPQDALAVVQAAKTRRLTQSARDHLELMRQAELGLLGERQRRVEEETALSSAIAAGAGVLGVASAGLGLFLFMRQSSRHRIRELQTELSHVSRLNTMGQTTSMMAHEINQPLSALRSYLNGVRRMMEGGSPPLDKITGALEKASAQVERAGEIIARLRRFVEWRETQIRPERLDLVIEEAIALMPLDTEQLAFRRQIPPDLPAVMVDRIEVQQVLINLMRNAVEAMGESARRELTVSAEMLAAEGAVRVSVADTGPGLPPRVAERLFQPFTSTKENGMGVGLSICRSIIEGLGGRIRAEANPEGGTTFHFTLPAAKARRAA
jgi:two-component system, LuxR family, sensor kinase FixL